MSASTSRGRDLTGMMVDSPAMRHGTDERSPDSADALLFALGKWPDDIKRCATGKPLAVHRYVKRSSGSGVDWFPCGPACDIPLAAANATVQMVAFMMAGGARDEDIDWPSVMGFAEQYGQPVSLFDIAMWKAPTVVYGPVMAVHVKLQEVKRHRYFKQPAAALRRVISRIGNAARRYNPLRVIHLLEELQAMQKQVRDAINALGSEVNTFTTDIGTFVKTATDVIAAQAAKIQDVADGKADADEVAAAITAQTARLGQAHQSLTAFNIPAVPDHATVPPIVTAPVVDPSADTIPAQPPVQTGDNVVGDPTQSDPGAGTQPGDSGVNEN